MGDRIITPDQLKAEACKQEIDMVLRKHQCIIIPRLVFQGPNMEFGWMVMALATIPDGYKKKS